MGESEPKIKRSAPTVTGRLPPMTNPKNLGPAVPRAPPLPAVARASRTSITAPSARSRWASPLPEAVASGREPFWIVGAIVWVLARLIAR